MQNSPGKDREIAIELRVEHKSCGCVGLSDVLALEVLIGDEAPMCYPVGFCFCMRQGRGRIDMLLQNNQQSNGRMPL